MENRDKLIHRGPDDAGIWSNNSHTAALAHRRLSIIDLSEASHQPFVSADGHKVIVFNGEIYNYREIREELKIRGHRFHSEGDTEVILAAYDEWGYSCLDRFNGMFAFAIYNHGDEDSSGELFLARDRVGKKPLYYAHNEQTFAFASELKAIPKTLRGGIDLQGLNHYLALGYVPFEHCIVEGVRKLLPGHAARFSCRDGSFKSWRYWSLPRNSQEIDLSGEMFAEQAWRLLKKSVSLRLRSDVPVGVFLSGGLDSSLITAAAATVWDRPVKTFTISVPGSPIDESSHAALVAKHFSTEHNVLEVFEPNLNTLDVLAPFIDEPLADSSIIPTFMVSQLTARHVKVALGGDGGDELFGGYRYYQQALLDQKRLRMVPHWLVSGAAKLAAMLPAGVRGRNRLLSLHNGAVYARVWGGSYFDAVLRRHILTPDMIDALGDEFYQPEKTLSALMGHGGDVIDAMTRVDFESILPDDFLVKVDRASMANSLEVRSPFLDYRLVEYAFGRIPSVWKVNYTERRRVQNLMAAKYLPAGFEFNRKQGFSVPLDAWLRKIDVRERLQELPDFISRGQCENLIEGQKAGRTNASRIFALMMLAISYRNLCLGES